MNTLTMLALVGFLALPILGRAETLNNTAPACEDVETLTGDMADALKNQRPGKLNRLLTQTERRCFILEKDTEVRVLLTWPFGATQIMIIGESEKGILFIPTQFIRKGQ